MEQWIYFLSTSDIPEDADAPGLKAAREKLRLSKMTKEEQAAYRRYLDNRVILADQIFTAKGEGRLEGKAEGRGEGHEEDARRRKGDNMPRELISKYTGLTVDEIEKL